eukprot:TRINITY_DN49546_c0_g1_i1.p1 TRINITY_DN49546_c0_g1~~TRINITY_DN49546_c0_g1_i1.p1  ORF type:complete len:525 (-),score=77.58 TRINITY_DN49546_c0_g1_i1:175-1749(-)
MCLFIGTQHLTRCASTCTQWRSACCSEHVWRRLYGHDYGAHAVQWASELHPVEHPRAWWARHMQRWKCQAARSAGCCIKRTVHFEFDDDESKPPHFFVACIALDGSLLVTGEYDQVSDWDLGISCIEPRNTYLGLEGLVTAVAADHVSKLVAGAAGLTVKLWSTQTQTCLASFDHQREFVSFDSGGPLQPLMVTDPESDPEAAHPIMSCAIRAGDRYRSESQDMGVVVMTLIEAAEPMLPQEELDQLPVPGITILWDFGSELPVWSTDNVVSEQGAVLAVTIQPSTEQSAGRVMLLDVFTRQVLCTAMLDHTSQLCPRNNFDRLFQVTFWWVPNCSRTASMLCSVYSTTDGDWTHATGTMAVPSAPAAHTAAPVTVEWNATLDVHDEQLARMSHSAFRCPFLVQTVQNEHDMLLTTHDLENETKCESKISRHSGYVVEVRTGAPETFATTGHPDMVLALHSRNQNIACNHELFVMNPNRHPVPVVILSPTNRELIKLGHNPFSPVQIHVTPDVIGDSVRDIPLR